MKPDRTSYPSGKHADPGQFQFIEEISDGTDVCMRENSINRLYKYDWFLLG